MSEYYTQLLIPVLKTCRPTGTAVAAFVQQIVEHRYIGDEYVVRFSRIVRVEPRMEKWPKPLTGKTEKWKTPSRKWERAEVLSTMSAIATHAEAADEYRILISSTSRPRHSLLELGSWEKDGGWHPWSGEYCLDLDIHVRNSLVQVCDIDGKQADSFHESDPTDDSGLDGDAIGLSYHPESREFIRVPKTGYAMAWVRVTPGKFLYPQLKEGSLELIDPGATEIVKQLFAGEFVQACEWG